MEQIPLSLQQAIESGKCVLFLGAGIGEHLVTNGKPLPVGLGLAQELCEKFDIDPNGNYDLKLVSKVIEIQKGRKELESYLHKRLSNAEPDEYLQWLLSLNWRSIYTTNFDEGIEKSFSLNSNPIRNPIIYSLSQDIIDYDQRLEVPIIHLHGTLYGVRKSNIVITTQDYITYKEKRRMLFELLKRDAAISTILYVGYSNKDPNWNALITELQDEFSPKEIPNSYRVAPNTDELEKTVLKDSGVTTIDLDLAGFVKSLKSSINAQENIDNLGKYRENIPSDFHVNFDECPAAVLRLFNSWVYVNQAPFDEGQNIQAFLKGDKPNWALVSHDNFFKRDIEDSVYDECLEYITSSKERPSVISLMEPAGYGTTTFLMSLAVRLVKDKAGYVFFLRESASLGEGDIEFSINSLPSTCIFFIDNASSYKEKIQEVVHKYRDGKKHLLFVLGSRKNEWLQLGGGRLGKEFNLEQLSENEIGELLDFLEKNGSLGVLEPLSHELRVAAIKTKLGKELLVTMREATEGHAFDAILEGEYRNIGDEISQKIYLIVSCFYQYGSLLRTRLLAELCEIDESDLHPVMNQYLDGVIITEEINISLGVYGVRPRHRKIAEIIWERCGEKSMRDMFLQRSLELLNLNFKSDKDAFENFILSDNLIDSISDFDGKVKFFETACRKDPANAYIWQHYARMLSREKKFDLALNQIDKAINIDSKRILYHTKGKILADIAFNSDSVDIARKRLSQSEAAFNYGLGIKSNDEYCLHGLAELYFGWAKYIKSHDADEANDYMAKAESQISEALKKASNKEELWILSSKISDFIGDNPSQVRALANAIQASNTGDKARFILGKVYRKQQEYDMACSILQPVFTNNPEDFRVAIEYAKSLLGAGKLISEAIAVLNLSTLQGYKDPRFISFLGGLYFLEGRFTDAENVFSETQKQNFSNEESRSAHFKPKDFNDMSKPYAVLGKVISVKKGYAFIEITGYPDNIICPGSKWGVKVLKSEMEVKCELAFSAKGPVAVQPQEIKTLL